MSSTPETNSAVNAVRAYIDSTGAPFESLRELHKAIEIVTDEEVQRARNLGAPWTVIAERLGITRQTAVARYRQTAVARYRADSEA